MTTKEMSLFIDTWATLVLEHPIVGAWFMEILNRKADRKTEPSDYKKWEAKPPAEVPKVNTNCVGVMAYMLKDELDMCDDCEYSLHICAHKSCKYKDEPTVSKMEQVEDEPQTERSEK